MEKDSDIKSLNSMKIFQPETTVQCRNSNKYTKLLQEEISFDAFFIISHYKPRGTSLSDNDFFPVCTFSYSSHLKISLGIIYL